MAPAAGVPDAAKILGKIKKTVRYAFWVYGMINKRKILIPYAQEVFFMKKKFAILIGVLAVAALFLPLRQGLQAFRIPACHQSRRLLDIFRGNIFLCNFRGLFHVLFLKMACNAKSLKQDAAG